MEKIENEKRFLLKPPFSETIFSGCRKQEIRQGYLEQFGSKELRVRIIDEQTAIVGTKEGKGASRREEEHEISLEAGRFLLGNCHSFLEKTRYFPACPNVQGVWTADFLKAPLAGIIIAEFECDKPPETVELPPWARDAKDVTDSLSNAHLARLAAEMRAIGDKPSLYLYDALIQKKIPRIVLTGGPCSGKTKILEKIKEQFGNSIQCVPEVATELISGFGINPKTNHHRFTTNQYRLQSIFEATSEGQASDEGKRALILDRGTADGAAYLKGGWPEFMSLCRTSKEHEFSKYQLVICLEVPPRTVYEKNRTNNPARYENYEDAFLIGERIKQAWAGHPHLNLISNYHGWDEKEHITMHIIKKFIETNN